MASFPILTISTEPQNEEREKANLDQLLIQA
jgi:hypothetical protein